MDANFTSVTVFNITPEDGMLEPYVARVSIAGTTPLPYVEVFGARFDAETVEAVTVDMQGTGFSGYLKNMPPDDAQLFVEFDGEDPLDTGLTFSGGGGPNV